MTAYDCSAGGGSDGVVPVIQWNSKAGDLLSPRAE
jgi:hypothetical protein